MDEADAPLTGATDPMGPWTIKVVSNEVRQGIVRAAQIEGVTVGQWLERRYRQWVADGSPVTVATAGPVAATRGAGAEAAPPDRPALPAPPTGRTAAEIAEYLDLYERVAKLRGKEIPPNAEALVGAERAIRLALRGGG